MHELVLEIKTHKILRNFKIQIHRIILARKSNLMIKKEKKKKKKSVKKKERTCRIVSLTVPADHRVKIKENEKRELK